MRGPPDWLKAATPFVCLIGTVATFALFLGVIDQNVARVGLPLAVFGIPRPQLGVAAAIELGLLSTAQCVFLYGLTRRSEPFTSVFACVTGLSVCALFMLSLLAPFVGSDAYYYVFYGRSPSLVSAYRVQAHPQYDKGYAALGEIIASPVVPSVYGPLWQIADRSVVARADNLRSAFMRLRFLNAIALTILVFGVIANRFPSGVTAALLCNPALYYEYIASAHNDIMALAGVVWIRPLLARQQNLIALIIGGLIGATKISIIVVAVAAFAQAENLRTRIFLVVGALAVATLVSIALGGSDYFHAIRTVAASTQRRDGPAITSTLRLLLGSITAAFALGATLLVLLRRRLLRWAAFTFLGVSSAIQGWYLAWGIGYAVMNAELVAEFAVALPLLTYLIDTQLHDSVQFPNTILAYALILGAAVFGAVTRRTYRIAMVESASFRC